jgi:Ca2+-dependent lipid-binding protein
MQILTYSVIEAKGISDPIDGYAVVSVNHDVKAKTPTKYKETHPVWDEEYTLYCSITI